MLNTLSNKNLVKQQILGVKPTDADPVQGGYNNVPFMPPIQPQQGGNNVPFMPPVQPQAQNPQQKDPNISEYDTVERTYVPTLDFNNPIPYADPMTNPNAEKNYNTAQQIADKADRLADDVEKFINGKD